MLSAAPVILHVTTEQDYEAVSEKVDKDVVRLYELLADVDPAGIESRPISVIKSLVQRLDLNLVQLRAIAFNNLSLVEQRRELLKQLNITQSRFQGLLASRSVILEGKVANLRRIIRTTEEHSANRFSGMLELVESLDLLSPLEQTRRVVSLVKDLIIKAGSADSRAELVALSRPLDDSLAQLETSVARLDAPLQVALGETIQQFRGFAKGRHSLLLVRERELDSVEGQEQLSKNADIVGELTESLHGMVTRAKEDIAQASSQARAVQRIGSITVLAVVVLSLVSSALIVWLYVDRNLLARLESLKRSMLAIAAGNLNADIPVPRTDELGDMVRALMVFRNIAIEVEDGHLREIAAARQQILDAIQSITDGIALYDADDQLVLCNSRYQELLRMAPGTSVAPGTSFEAIIRNFAASGLVPDANGRIEAWINERLGRHRQPGPAYVQELRSGAAYRVTEGRTTDGGAVVVYTDVTELIQAEAELREILETSPLGVAIIRGHEFLFANSRLAQLSRTPRDRIMERRVEDAYVDPNELRQVVETVERVGYVRDVEVRFKRDDGSQFWGLLWANRVTYQGKIAHVGWTSDISPRKEAEVTLRQAKEAAESANRTKSQFLANMSHELRTPLTAILGYTELIADNVYGDVPVKIRDVLERVEKNSRQLLGHINDVLDVSKIEAGQLSLTLDDYSMRELVETVLTALGSLAAEKKLTLTTNVWV